MTSEAPPLWDHQKTAVTKAIGLNSDFAFFMEMGTGKTRTMIEILKTLGDAKTLILCPPIVVAQWRSEILKYSAINPGSVVLLTGTQKNRIKLLGYNRSRIAVTNYESLLMKDLFGDLKEWAPNVIVADESHKIKSPESKRSKAMWQLAKLPSVKHRYIMTGTPVLNSPIDLFSQFKFMDKGATFGDNFYSFRARYFFDKNAYMPKATHFPNWQPKPGCFEEINRLLEPVSFKIKKEECLDLPPLVKKVVEVELSPEQAKHYEQMRKDFVAYVNDKACVAQLAITKALRLQQIVSGHIPTEGLDGKEIIRYKNTPREAVLKELLEEITPDHKVLVWAVFKENYEQIRRVCESLGIDYVQVHGEVPTSQRNDAINRFNTEPNVRVYIGHPGSGGIGVNLTVSSYSIFYSRSFSLEQTLQAESRNHRGGSERHQRITRVDLVTPGTIDELIMQRLNQKENLSEELIFSLANELARQ
jgi:SNF2 family DNA or RNA helicase